MNSNSVRNDFEKTLVAAYVFLGIVIICGSLVVGPSYALSALVLSFSLFVTAGFRKYPLPWIFLVSLLAANPINSAAVFPCSLILVFCLILYHMQYLFELPRWLYILAFLSILGFFISSKNWMSSVRSILQQTNYMINYLMMPIILLPVIYLRMVEEKDSHVKLKGLIYFLIIPSTLILLLAYIFGRPIKTHSAEITFEVIYKFVNTEVVFTRTQSGFIFASLICASTAVIILRPKFINQLLAAICLAVNVLFLLSTGSVGSIIACLCGIGAIFYCASRRMRVMKYFTSTFAIVCIFLSIWVISPPKVKDYIGLRYKERFVAKGINADDRITLWKQAFNYSLEHPEGVGWSWFYIYKSKTIAVPHNDYLLYAINYGIIAGLTYAYLILRLLIFFYRKSKTIIQDPPTLSLNLAGLGVTTVVLINSISDNLAGNKWYFNVIWSILWYAYFSCHSDSNLNSRQSHPGRII